MCSELTNASLPFSLICAHCLQGVLLSLSLAVSGLVDGSKSVVGVARETGVSSGRGQGGFQAELPSFPRFANGWEEGGQQWKHIERESERAKIWFGPEPCWP